MKINRKSGAGAHTLSENRTKCYILSLNKRYSIYKIQWMKLRHGHSKYDANEYLIFHRINNARSRWRSEKARPNKRQREY